MPRCYDLVTFITDYGLSGGFVGALHAVVDSFSPGARRIDLDHLVPPQDVVLGAVRLRRAMRHTRPGVHVAVVDPGVGTSRRGLALEAGGRAFIGPDNGILMPAAAAVGGVERAVSLARPDEAGSRTFDGRDLFAPAAGRLLAGEDLLALGSPLDPGELVTLELPGPLELPDGAFELTVMQVDAFGNVQFAWEEPPLHRLGAAVAVLAAGGKEAVVPLGTTFADVAEGSPLLLEDSDGCLALSVNRGRADRLLDLSPGKKVICRPLGLQG